MFLKRLLQGLFVVLAAGVVYLLAVGLLPGVEEPVYKLPRRRTQPQPMPATRRAFPTISSGARRQPYL